MVGAVGWIVVAWVLLSLPLGICIGAVLRHSAVGLGVVVEATSSTTHTRSRSIASAPPLTARAAQSLRGPVKPPIRNGANFYRRSRLRA